MEIALGRLLQLSGILWRQISNSGESGVSGEVGCQLYAKAAILVHFPGVLSTGVMTSTTCYIAVVMSLGVFIGINNGV